MSTRSTEITIAAAGQDSTRGAAAVREGRLVLAFSAVSLLGLAVDAVVLQLLIGAGMPAAWARVISLLSALQVTYVLNALHVFRVGDRGRPWRRWAAYMSSSGSGAFCNYWIFLTLVSTHWKGVSRPMVALCAGAFIAWLISYLGARFLVFRPAPP